MDAGLATLAVATNVEKLLGHAQNLANELGVALFANNLEEKNSEFSYYLQFTGSSVTDFQLALVTNAKPFTNISVDFIGGKTGYRIRRANPVTQPLAKAVGLKKGMRPNIIDATAGMGRDAAVLADLGCHISLIERSPVMSALLDDGLRRLALQPQTQDSIITRLRLHKGDARVLIPSITPADVIYLDPMYPKREKQALVKKEMRFARDIVGNDRDIAELFTIALNHARKRVVVKRPRLAPSLTQHPPSHAIFSKNTRYDIYVI